MKKLKYSALIVAFIFAMIQIVLLVLFFHSEQYSDQKFYVDVAQKSYSYGELYPSINNLHDVYIVAPTFINFLVLQIKLFGSTDYNGIVQFFMNMIMLYEVFYIGRKIFSIKVGYIAAIIYCLLYSNYMGILVWGTEIPFLFLALSGLCLCLTQKWYNILLASILLALGNTIRPISSLFILTIIFFFLYYRASWKKYILLVFPFVTFIWGYGAFNEMRMGYFVNKSTTGGVNLVMTANDFADGTTAKGSYILNDGSSKLSKINLSKKTVFEKDSIWKEAGIKWIKQNPKKYASMFIKKIPYLYADDAWPERLVFDSGFSKNLTKQSSNSVKLQMIGAIILKNILYYMLLVVFVYSIVVKRKQILTDKGILLAIFVLGTGATVLLPVMPRYHYPFLFVIILWAAYGIEGFVNNKN